MPNKNHLKAYGGSSNQQSYSNIPNPGNPTYTEAWALVEAARRMATAIQSGPLDDSETKKMARDALRLNWRLWTIFQTELSLEEEPGMPLSIRENMLNLCNYVDKYTVDAISEPTPEKISGLIEINRNIANGLMESLHSALDDAESGEGPEQTEKAEPITSIDTDV